VFWLSTIILTLIAWGTAPFAGLIASFYTSEEDVKVVVKELLWLNALFKRQNNSRQPEHEPGLTFRLTNLPFPQPFTGNNGSVLHQRRRRKSGG
jgi:hypothetical protein